MTPKQKDKLNDAVNLAKREYDDAFSMWMDAYLEKQDMPFDTEEQDKLVQLARVRLKAAEAVFVALQTLRTALLVTRRAYDFSIEEDDGSVF